MGERKRKLAAAMRKQRQASTQQLERKPAPDDPVFFDPDHDTARAHMLEAMRAAGTPPHLVYAFAKTGFIVNEHGYRQMSPADRAEYDAAIKEYFAMEQEHNNRN